MLFETKDYKVEAEKKEGCILEAKFTASKECVQRLHKKAIKNINKEVSLPGFRKGKVPDETVLKKFPNQVEQEWKELLLNDGLQQAFALTKIYPLNKGALKKPKIEKCTLEEGAVFTLSYEYYPVIPEIDFSSIEVPRREIPEVTEEEMQDVLHDILESHATWQELSDHVVAEGDYIMLTIDRLEDGERKPIAHNRRFHVTKKGMGEWMREALLGKKAGDSLEAESFANSDSTEEFKARFKKGRFSLMVHATMQATFPELTDEFAKKLGADSVSDLKERIKRDLIRESEETLNEERFADLKKALLEKYPIDLPLTLKEEEKNERFRMKVEALKKENLSDDEIKKREKEIEKEALAEGERSLKLYFLTQQIAKQGHIEVTSEEINEGLKRYFTTKKMSDIPREFVSRYSNQLFQIKVKEYALSQLA